MAEIQWHPEALLQKMKAAAMDALHEAGEIVLKEWGNTIPHATGDLESSLTVTDQPSQMRVIVSSTGPYAIRQELDDSLRHPDPTNPSSRSGRKAHAGRDALNNNRENIAKFVRDRMK
ncbi:MAG TPA: HK97 gp10 family phage protein [Methanothrix soehngenii]|nr:HK97 gp10 family phage protein [Methanothrix soehngenii]